MLTTWIHKVIALDAEGRPVASVLEAAKLEGLKTGLVVTSRITHATPAGLYNPFSHGWVHRYS